MAIIARIAAILIPNEIIFAIVLSGESFKFGRFCVGGSSLYSANVSLIFITKGKMSAMRKERNGI